MTSRITDIFKEAADSYSVRQISDGEVTRIRFTDRCKAMIIWAEFCEYIDRELLFRTQTPHTYTLGKLLWAHEEAERRHITGTAATCTLMQQLGETIYFSKGSETNLKITTVEDLQLAAAVVLKR